MKVAAVADLHAREGDAERLRDIFEGAAREADALALAGDLTDHGLPGEAQTLLEALDGYPLPVLATLGNHDHESGAAEELSRRISGGLHLLDRSGETSVELGGVGFAGVKGFGGGFDAHAIDPFGESAIKEFVSTGSREAEALESGLRALGAEKRVALLHYAPVRETVGEEPPEIHAFLGASRLGSALDSGGATVAVHGHAHLGGPRGETPGGVPVFNVSLPILMREKGGRPYRLLEV